jgi:hypothetical protein
MMRLVTGVPQDDDVLPVPGGYGKVGVGGADKGESAGGCLLGRVRSAASGHPGASRVTPAAYPGHRTVTVREDRMMAACTRFFTERVFGPDRAAMLTAHLPASAAADAQRHQKRAAALRKKLTKIDVSERALVTELEAPIDPADAAA